MKNFFNRAITFSIISIFTVFSLLCCCLTNIVQAETSEVFTYQKIVQDNEISSEEHHSENHKDCSNECGLDKIWAISKNSSLNKFKFKLVFNQFNKLFLFMRGAFNDVCRICSFPKINQGPPGKLENTIPIYLQHSVLRI